MEILLPILLLGLVLLAAANRGLGRRLGAVERQLSQLIAATDAEERHVEAQRAAVAQRLYEAAPAPGAPSPIEPAPEPLPEPERHAPELEPETSAPAGETVAGLFERLVGGRLLVWIGGIALAIAGVFLVRYTVEIGLVTPPVRMLLAAAFGLLLIGAGEFFRTARHGGADPRTAQALVGAGIFVLYAATYGSLTLYGLIGLGTASLLMGLITAGALVLALRHGAPTAVMGLTGGFLTPLLVGDPESGAVPLLAYLALLNAGLFALAARRGWTWLAAGAVVLSFAWSALLLLSPGPGDALAAGVFIVALGIAASVARPGGGRELRLLQPAAIGLVQLALLVGRTDLGLAAWALFGTLALATMVLATRRAEYRLLPAGALLLTLLLIAAKAMAGFDPHLPMVAAAATILFAGFAVPRAVRSESPGDRLLWAFVATAAFAGPVLILRGGQSDFLARYGWGLLVALLAAGPGWLAWRLRGSEARAVPVAVGGAALLLIAAAHDLAPREWLPAAWLLIGIGTALAARKLADAPSAVIAAAVGGLGAAAAAASVPELWETVIGSWFGFPALAGGLPAPLDALKLLAIPGALLVLLWRTLPQSSGRLGCVLLGTGALLLLAAAYVLFKRSFGLADAADFAARGFAERMLITQALFLAGWLVATRRVRVAGLDGARLGAMLTAFAAVRLAWFDLLAHNPALVDQHVGSLPVLNLLLPTYLGSAAWLYLARRRAKPGASGLWLALFLAALVTGVMLMVRQLFQGSLLSMAALPLAEFYGYSLAGLLLAIALLAAGVRLPDKALRVAGLAVLTATIVKVFLIDAAELEGLLRILSFMGLGVALIGVGKLYGNVLGRTAKA